MLAYDDFGRGVNIIEGNAVLGVGDIGIQVTAGIPLSPFLPSPSLPLLPSLPPLTAYTPSPLLICIRHVNLIIFFFFVIP